MRIIWKSKLDLGQISFLTIIQRRNITISARQIDDTFR